MKFSVVIPTHDRLELLRDAIQTVVRQKYDDWELVIFDNCSSDDIAEHVRGLSDRRVRYARSNEFLPVTESWNRAIDLASGDYVVFLGDDDGLTPGYFRTVADIIAQFNAPELLYCALYQFLHPGVAPWERRGYVADLKNGFFFAGRKDPFLLSRTDVATAVEGSLRLRRNFTFNIQAFVFSRLLLNRLRIDGAIFRSPFPDYYMANVALAKATSIIVVPAPMSIAGVSKASFGYTLFNNLEERGAQILNAKLASDPLFAEVERRLLPGPLYNTNYVLTMEHVLKHAHPLVLRGVDYGRYRQLQLLAVLNAAKGWLPGSPESILLWSRLTFAERIKAVGLSMCLLLARTMRMRGRVHNFFLSLAKPYGYIPNPRILDKGSFSRLIEIFDALELGRLPGPSLNGATAL